MESFEFPAFSAAWSSFLATVMTHRHHQVEPRAIATCVPTYWCLVLPTRRVDGTPDDEVRTSFSHDITTPVAQIRPLRAFV
jgi:hypothetical protein